MDYKQLLIDKSPEEANGDFDQKPILLNLILTSSNHSDPVVTTLSAPLSVHDIYGLTDEVSDLINTYLNKSAARKNKNVVFHSIDSMATTNQHLLEYLESFNVGHTLAGLFRDYPKDQHYIESLDWLDAPVVLDISSGLPLKRKSRSIESLKILLTFLPFNLRSKYNVDELVDALVGFVAKDSKLKSKKKTESLANHVQKHMPITLSNFETIENLDRTYVEISKLAELINSI